MCVLLEARILLVSADATYVVSRHYAASRCGHHVDMVSQACGHPYGHLVVMSKL